MDRSAHAVGISRPGRQRHPGERACGGGPPAGERPADPGVPARHHRSRSAPRDAPVARVSGRHVPEHPAPGRPADLRGDGVVFPVATLWGTFLHASGPLLVGLTVCAVLGGDAAVARIRTARHWSRENAWMAPAALMAIAVPLAALEGTALASQSTECSRSRRGRRRRCSSTPGHRGRRSDRLRPSGLAVRCARRPGARPPRRVGRQRRRPRLARSAPSS